MAALSFEGEQDVSVFGEEDVGFLGEGSVLSSLHCVGESRDCPIVGIVRAGSEIECWNDQFPCGESVSVPGELFGDGVVRRWGGVLLFVGRA